MKYKILKDSELKALEEDFVAFLISNGVHNEEWIEINEKEPDKAIALVELFSDIVWEKALKQIKIIEHTTKNVYQLFKYNSDSAVLVGVNSVGNQVDFEDKKWMEEIVKNPQKFEIFSLKKDVKPEQRAQEIFSLLQTGCTIGELKTFDWLLHLFELVKKSQ
jgi:hypothetical protein